MISRQDHYTFTIPAKKSLREAYQKLFRLCELPPLLLAAIAGAGLHSVNEIAANNAQFRSVDFRCLLVELVEIILKRIKQPFVIYLIV